MSELSMIPERQGEGGCCEKRRNCGFGNVGGSRDAKPWVPTAGGKAGDLPPRFLELKKLKLFPSSYQIPIIIQIFFGHSIASQEHPHQIRIDSHNGTPPLLL